ncbi:hypothetical protein EG340_09500 [Chryseobacterium indoltheticum]|uniref:Uncharacterized protein n=1 Tax=Chryseobacterium indoltheticum TaxID=254 RepID=A0A3G6MZS3_9FLAO|nr:hypothetical protein EG340_09500 [Chryseobacterium indoltheticum]
MKLEDIYLKTFFILIKRNYECPLFIIRLKSAVILSFRRNPNTLKVKQFRSMRDNKQTVKIYAYKLRIFIKEIIHQLKINLLIILCSLNNTYQNKIFALKKIKPH